MVFRYVYLFISKIKKHYYIFFRSSWYCSLHATLSDMGIRMCVWLLIPLWLSLIVLAVPQNAAGSSLNNETTRIDIFNFRPESPEDQHIFTIKGDIDDWSRELWNFVFTNIVSEKNPSSQNNLNVSATDNITRLNLQYYTNEISWRHWTFWGDFDDFIIQLRRFIPETVPSGTIVLMNIYAMQPKPSFTVKGTETSFSPSTHSPVVSTNRRFVTVYTAHLSYSYFSTVLTSTIVSSQIIPPSQTTHAISINSEASSR